MFGPSKLVRLKVMVTLGNADAENQEVHLAWKSGKRSSTLLRFGRDGKRSESDKIDWAENINKVIKMEIKPQVLKDILRSEEGEFLAIMGPSGSGKFTSMNIITSLIVRLVWVQIMRRSWLRFNEQIGFLSFNDFSPIKTQCLQMSTFNLCRSESFQMKGISRTVFKESWARYADAPPSFCSSGGQTIRGHCPPESSSIILVDETNRSSLIRKTGEQIWELLTALNQERENHHGNPRNVDAAYTNVRLSFGDGVISSDSRNERRAWCRTGNSPLFHYGT